MYGFNTHEEAQKRADALIARNNALASLSQLLTADRAVTPEEKQLARKIIDRLTHNAAKKGFKGQYIKSMTNKLQVRG